MMKDNAIQRKRKLEALEATAVPSTPNLNINDLFKLTTDTAEELRKLEDRGDTSSQYYDRLVSIRDRSAEKIDMMLG